MFFKRRHERSTGVVRVGSIISRADMPREDDKPLRGRPPSIRGRCTNTPPFIAGIGPAADAIAARLQTGLEIMRTTLYPKESSEARPVAPRAAPHRGDLGRALRQGQSQPVLIKLAPQHVHEEGAACAPPEQGERGRDGRPTVAVGVERDERDGGGRGGGRAARQRKQRQKEEEDDDDDEVGQQPHDATVPVANSEPPMPLKY
jgi:hypothetical protein